MFKRWQSIALWKRVLVGLFLGLAIGLLLRYSLGSTQGESSIPVVVEPGATTAVTLEELNAPGDKRIIDAASIQAKHGTITENDGVFQYQPDPDWNGTDTVEYRFADPHGQAKSFVNTWVKPFGDAFVRLIKMLIIPLIATTLVAGVTAMGDPKRLGSLGARTIGLYLLTTLFAVSLGLGIGTIVQPGVGVNYEVAGADALNSVEGKLAKAEDSGGFVDRLLNIIPENPAAGISDGNVLQTIFFAILIGVGILLAGAAGDPLKRFFESASEVVMKITILDDYFELRNQRHRASVRVPSPSAGW